MAYSHSSLVTGGITTIADAAGALVTNAATTYIRLIIIHNANTTSETVTLYRVPDNAGAVGAAAETNAFWEDTLLPKETVTFEFAAQGLKLSDVNDTIQGVTTTASKVTFQAEGGTE